MTAAARLPEPHRSSAADSDVDGLEPSPEWAGDAIAAERFGSPEAIRAALLPEQVSEFDAALTAARQTLHLDQLRNVLRMWRRMALMTEQDPDDHLPQVRTGFPHVVHARHRPCRAPRSRRCRRRESTRSPRP